MSDDPAQDAKGDPATILRRMLLTERRRLYVLGQDPHQAFLWGNDVVKALAGEEPHWLAHMEESMPLMPANREERYAND